MASPVRCAVYTRKSSEEGLEQSFNSLHAQREACEAYVASQKHEGWSFIDTAYDDGGFSGGSMERPGLKALMSDVHAGLIDTVVVYKVDRLTRSLADFAKMVEQFDQHNVSFVSVTQAFNTTTSMGRLTLNVLLSFAQFEREVTGERIRDKIAASKAKGMWMGGAVPLGYDVKDRQLLVNEGEAEQVRRLFTLYLECKAVDEVVTRAAEAGITSKKRITPAGKSSGGGKLTRGSLYRIFANPIYVGEIGHKGKRHAGLHAGIIATDTFDAVQKILASNRRRRKEGAAAAAPALLAGLVVDGNGARLTSTHTRRRGNRYRYYAGNGFRLPAPDLETIVVGAVAARLASPKAIAALLPDLALYRAEMVASGAELAKALAGNDALGRRRAILRLVTKVTVRNDSLTIFLDLAPLGLPDVTTTLLVATQVGRAKARLSLVVPGEVTANPDAALIGIIAQARDWVDRLASGRAASLTSIAAADAVTLPYVRQLIGAAFLAPDLVTRIVEGRQPTWLTAAALKTMLPLAPDWNEQRALVAAGPPVTARSLA
jgi:site-specific DNA recombinase